MKHLICILLCCQLVPGILWGEGWLRVPAPARQHQVLLESAREVNFRPGSHEQYHRKKTCRHHARRYHNRPFRQGLVQNDTVDFTTPARVQPEIASLPASVVSVTAVFQYRFAVLKNEQCPLLQPPRLT